MCLLFHKYKLFNFKPYQALLSQSDQGSRHFYHFINGAGNKILKYFLCSALFLIQTHERHAQTCNTVVTTEINILRRLLSKYMSDIC